MSERRCHLDHDDSEGSEESDEAKPLSQAFQFIDLSSNDPSLRRKNLAKVRSHVGRLIRRRWQTVGNVQYERQRGPIPLSSVGQAVVAQDLYRQIPTNTNQSLLKPGRPPWPQLEADIGPTLMSLWSPTAHSMIYHRKLCNDYLWRQDRN